MKDALKRAGYTGPEPLTKQELIDKVRGQLNSIRKKRRCTPAEASKVRGTMGFTSMAQYGQLGRAYLDGPSSHGLQ